MRLRIALLCLAASLTLSAQTPSPDAWKTAETLGNIDMSSLTPVQKKAVLKLVREQDCSCQCGMKTAECIMKDSNCSYSRALAKIAIQGVKDGKTLLEISKLMDASPKAHRPKLLEDPITIPVAGAPVKGPADAKITLVEFSDFECPYCAAAVREVDSVMAAYPKDVKLIYKQFPLSMHPHAEIAAEASLAAREQGKFWEMYELLFKNSRALTKNSILVMAKDAGLDMDKFKAALESGKYKKEVAKDITDGENANVYGTPAFYINGKQYNGQVTLAALKPIFAEELKGDKKTVAAK
ncbi:MAG TPA: thioredoxin domain-containing protein [Bryobacteraceae bacterium]|nr:thioredoxin domain-containing protein [Bryobacteraceae bacterium]